MCPCAKRNRSARLKYSTFNEVLDSVDCILIIKLTRTFEKLCLIGFRLTVVRISSGSARGLAATLNLAGGFLFII